MSREKIVSLGLALSSIVVLGGCATGLTTGNSDSQQQTDQSRILGMPLQPGPNLPASTPNICSQYDLDSAKPGYGSVACKPQQFWNEHHQVDVRGNDNAEVVATMTFTRCYVTSSNDIGLMTMTAAEWNDAAKNAELQRLYMANKVTDPKTFAPEGVACIETDSVTEAYQNIYVDNVDPSSYVLMDDVGIGQ